MLDHRGVSRRRVTCLEHAHHRLVVGEGARADRRRLRGLPPADGRQRRDAREQAPEDRAARSAAQPLVELDVVLDEGLGVLELRPPDPYKVLEVRQLEVGCPLGGEGGHAGLQDTPCLEQGQESALVDLEQEVDWLGQKLRLERADEGALTVPAVEDVQRDQRPDRLAERRPAHAELDRELALRGQPLPGPDLAAHDHLLDRVDRVVCDWATAADCLEFQGRVLLGLGSGQRVRFAAWPTEVKPLGGLTTSIALGYGQPRANRMSMTELQRLSDGLRRARADAALLSSFEDVCYVSGFEVPPPIDAGAAFAYGPTLALATTDGHVALISPGAYVARAEDSSRADE